MKLEDNELINIYGGSISGTFINSIANAIRQLMDMGRSFGTALRMIISGKRC